MPVDDAIAIFAGYLVDIVVETWFTAAMTTTTRKLTTEDIEAGYRNADWLGWGYLGERKRSGADGALTAQADAIALKLANEQGMDEVAFFDWLNSKPGRHYGDLALGGGDPQGIEAKAREWNLVTKINAPGH